MKPKKLSFRAWVKDAQYLQDWFPEEYNKEFGSDIIILEVLVIDWLNEVVDLKFGNIEVPFAAVELMQRTNKTINKKYVYEGDILKDKDGNIGVVKITENGFKVVCDGKDHRFQEFTQILGNIYQNKTLLKKEEKE